MIAAQKSRRSALLRAVGALGAGLGAIAGESLLISAGVGGRRPPGHRGRGRPVGAVPTAGSDPRIGRPRAVPTALLTGFVVGIVVTAVAALFPAIRASRVPPLAALRDVAAESTGRMACEPSSGFLDRHRTGGPGVVALQPGERTGPRRGRCGGCFPGLHRVRTGRRATRLAVIGAPIAAVRASRDGWRGPAPSAIRGAPPVPPPPSWWGGGGLDVRSSPVP